MGASKLNPTTITMSGRGRFASDDLLRAESDRGLPFALAIERLRGWPVHSTYVGDEVVRYQAESGGDLVYDPRGILSSERYSNLVVLPLINGRRDWPPEAFQNGQLRVGTRCIGEDELFQQGLVDEAAVLRATELLRSNSVYLSLIPERPHPRYTADALRRYSWSGCAVYAEALSRVTGLPAAKMAADQLIPGHGLTGDQFHAVVLHPDGSVEDVWGRQSARDVAHRYAIARWHFDQDAHRAMIREALRVRPSAKDDLAHAERLILEHREAAGEQ